MTDKQPGEHGQRDTAPVNGRLAVAQWIPVLAIVLLGLAVAQEMFVPVGNFTQRVLRPGAYSAAFQCMQRFLSEQAGVSGSRLERRAVVRKLESGYQVEGMVLEVDYASGEQVDWRVSCSADDQGRVQTLRHSRL